LANVALQKEVTSRAGTEYLGGEARILTEDHHVDLALAF